MALAVSRARAWAPATKAAALFILPLPLTFALLAALITGDLDRLAITGGALACLWGAGVVALRALVGEARYLLGERPDPPPVPLKLLSGVMTACGVALAAVAAGHLTGAVVVFAALGALGHATFYGRDLRPPRIRIAAVSGVDTQAVALQLKRAYARLRVIDAAARTMARREFRDRLSRITGIGRSILVAIERNPADAARARRFLNLYLESAERVATEYARTHSHARDQGLDQSFQRLLAEMEHTFADQQRALMERDLLSLDVDIEVLNARLAHEAVDGRRHGAGVRRGASADLENQS